MEMGTHEVCENREAKEIQIVLVRPTPISVSWDDDQLKSILLFCS